MNKQLVLIVNGETKVEYDSKQPLSGLQRRFLTKMDTDMDQGFIADGKHISNPDKLQRMQFVANQAVNEFLNNKDKMIAICFAYLTSTTPELNQIHLDTSSSEHTINLIFENQQTDEK